jgi:DNA replication and repair protein RecF
LLGGALSLVYEPGWSADLSFGQALRTSEARDRSIGNTEVGPHRADLAIRLGGRRAQNVASRGQQKLLAAALILAQARVLEGRQSQRGVLLIDDPAAELDASSLERFMRAVASIHAQTIFTAITPEALPFSVDSAVFHVERGVLRAL